MKTNEAALGGTASFTMVLEPWDKGSDVATNICRNGARQVA
jgi:hypothetical protein